MNTTLKFLWMIKDNERTGKLKCFSGYTILYGVRTLIHISPQTIYSSHLCNNTLLPRNVYLQFFIIGLQCNAPSNRKKRGRNHIIIPQNAGNTSDNIQDSFVVKSFNKPEIEGKFPNTIKCIYEETHS